MHPRTPRLRPALRAFTAALSVSFAAGAALAQQTVYLDFDTKTGGSDYVFSTSDRDTVQSMIEADFAQFDFTFTQTAPMSGEYSTIIFNEGSTFTWVEKTDFRNLDKSDIGWVQTGDEFESFVEEVDPTASYLQFTANLAARTVGELVGLEFHDALGPLGSGYDPDQGYLVDPKTVVGPPLDPDPFYLGLPMDPAFIGPYNATETGNHLMETRLGFGSVTEMVPVFDNMGNPVGEEEVIIDFYIEEVQKRAADQYFGPRAAIKLAFNEQQTVIAEAAIPRRPSPPRNRSPWPTSTCRSRPLAAIWLGKRLRSKRSRSRVRSPAPPNATSTSSKGSPAI